MERLIEILEDIHPDIDYATCTDLIDGHRLDSLSIISLVAELEDEYDITIPAVEIIPANFNSAAAILKMVERLQEDE
ncbi:phosphopantetheine-binding protein [Yeguia hominis]|uniref:Acyl carrier protein n=1 Tax=Yeguia hominis TaxID=2763662 RepID=A0A926D9B4_9FIRM|nr:phosphopantetheine-binding protein [Yeguia hominis]MBC8533752.1 acyl carrier protein [Yeguia hominis]